jgi:hypothetical protein
MDEIDGGLMPGLQPAAGFFHGATSFSLLHSIIIHSLVESNT